MENTIVLKNELKINGVLWGKPGMSIDKERLLKLIYKGEISLEFLEAEANNICFTEEELLQLQIASEANFLAASEEILKVVEENCSNEVLSYLRAVPQLETRSHSIRVAIIATSIAISMGLSDELIKIIAVGALLHDSGKLFFKKLVEKPGKLTDDEFKKIKEHTSAGYRFLKNFSKPVREIALYHHERINGSGYWGITNIPIYIQVVGLADCIDAMASVRVYKNGMPIKEVFRKLDKERISYGDAFNPQLLAAAKKIFSI